jgi:DNA repair photolyase
VLRDLDLLSDLAGYAAVTVHMTITTMDEHLWRLVEPTTPKPWKRIEALRVLHERGIRTGVFLSPILPWLTDDEGHMESVVAAASRAGVDFIVGQPLRLAPGVKDYYFEFVDREYPQLAERYRNLYAGTHAGADYARKTGVRLDAIRRRYGLSPDRLEAAPPPPSRPAVRQLAMFDAVA